MAKDQITKSEVHKLLENKKSLKPEAITDLFPSA